MCVCCAKIPRVGIYIYGILVLELYSNILVKL
jgi:hypothetical protein